MGTKRAIIVVPQGVDQQSLRQTLLSSDWEATYCDSTSAATTQLLARGGDALITSLSLASLSDLAPLYRARELTAPDDLVVIATCQPTETETLQSYLKGLTINAWLSEPYTAQALANLLPNEPASQPLNTERLNSLQATLVKQNYFERLGVAYNANVSTIRREYNRRLRELTESPCEGDPNEVRLIQRSITNSLNEALATLRNNERRLKYLESLEKTPKTSTEPSRKTAASQADVTAVHPPQPTVEELQPAEAVTAPPRSADTEARQPEPPPTAQPVQPKERAGLLNELLGTDDDAGATSEGDDFDSILASIVGRHQHVEDNVNSAQSSPRRKLGSLFDAAVGAVVETSTRVADEQENQPPISEHIAPIKSDALNNTEWPSPNDEAAKPLGQTAGVPKQSMPLGSAPDGSTAKEDQRLTQSSSEPNERVSVVRHSEGQSIPEIAPSLVPQEPHESRDTTDGDEEGSVPAFGDRDGISDRNEDDAAASVDAATSGPAVLEETPTERHIVGPAPEPEKESASNTGPRSAAQLAAQALAHSRETKQPSRDSVSVEAEDASSEQEQEPTFERMSVKEALAPDSRVLDYSARMHAAMGNYSKAKQLTERALKDAPSRRLDYRLALIHAQQKLATQHEDHAKDILKELIRTHTNHDEAAALLESLDKKRSGIFGLFRGGEE